MKPIVYVYCCFLLLVGLIFPTQVVTASVEINNLRFTHLTNTEGISQQHVTSLVQDNRGLMWIGTKNGLCLYNGYEIKKYFNDIHDPSSLTHNFIHSLFLDKQNRIWVGTEKGLCRYLSGSDTFIRYPNIDGANILFAQNASGEMYVSSQHSLFFFDEKKGAFKRIEAVNDSSYIHAIAIDKDERFWVSSKKGLKVYDKQFLNVSEFVQLKTSKDKFEYTDVITALYPDSVGNMWAGKAGNGIVKIDIATNEMKFWTKGTGLPDGLIRTIEQDSQGNLWFGSEKGLIIMSKDEKLYHIQQNFTNTDGLNDNAIYKILRDRDNNMWIGTYFGGINICIDAYKKFQYYKVGYSSHNLKGKAIREIVEDGDNILWVATEDGGLNKLDKTTGEITKINSFSLTDNVHTLLLDPISRKLWVGMFRGGITIWNLKDNTFKNYTEENGLSSNFVFTLAQDLSGTVWAGGSRGLQFYNKENQQFEKINHTQLSELFIYTLFVDSNNNLWVGTRNRGLYCFNQKTGVINHWLATNREDTGLTDNFITSILEDSKKRIWVGTNNGGLHLVDGKKINVYKNQSIQKEKCIYGILEDDNKRLWISTNNGLISLDFVGQSTNQYTTDEGLPINQFNYHSCLKQKDGMLYFGTVNGLISFYPNKLEALKKRSINIILENLYIGNQTVTTKEKDSPLQKSFDETEEITLDHAQAQSFSIEYAAISLENNKNIVYSVKLEGLNNEWNYVNNQRRIIYSGIPHGEYIFRVRATPNGESWDKAQERILRIKILPPFYLSTWAFLIYFLVALAIAWGIYKFVSIRIKTNNLLKIEQIEKENIKALNELKMGFFTNMSHELQTPLSLIITPLQNLISTIEFSQEIEKSLSSVLRNAQRMVRLIEELITFNRIESKQLEVNLQNGNPLDFIGEIFSLFQDMASKKEVQLELKLENNDENVWYSLSFVEKIVSNLLSNAIKFTPNGGQVTLSSSIVERGEEIFLNIIVEDTGIGIMPEERDNIFKNFYRTYRGKTHQAKGWGIGLALTQNLVNLHKGHIGVESKVGEGSKFDVLLNVTESAFSEKERFATKANESFLKQYNYEKINLLANDDLGEEREGLVKWENKDYTILLVEDNREFAAFLSEYFSGSYNVLLADNGEQALFLAEQHNPDLIISDIMMPIMDGVSLCKSLKNDLKTSHILIILLTAKHGSENMILGYESGADMYLEKPFNVEILGLQVQNLLRTRDVNREKLKENPELDIASTSIGVRDQKFLNQIKSYIEDNLGNEYLSTSDIVTDLGISRTVLYRKMKSIMDMPINEYIKFIRLVKSKTYLLDGRNVSETAYDVGFSDPGYFSKCFKKQFGVTPSDFVLRGKENLESNEKPNNLE